MRARDDEVLAVVQQWIEKAEHDFTTAIYTLTLGQACPTDTVCFHVQQCVEKYLKAILVLNGIEFGRTHQISALMALTPEQVRPDLTAEDQERLTDYAVTTRYPGDYDSISLVEARQSAQLARRVRRQIRKSLPLELRH